ncbi:DUF6305 family protein [Mesotoga prima]|uniref:DUF6305 family protein n=1 Tax=Mesotoga prima TaxID=1184387 RepID=UPI000305C76C
MSLLKIATIFLILIASSVLCSLSIEPLPVIEDPVLFTVWGESIELQNINYFCDSLQVARDYSPGASIEDLCEGAGFRIEEELSGESFHPFYVSGTPYRTLVIIAGSSLPESRADIERIEELASSVKSSNGLVMVIDIDVEGSGDDPLKQEFDQRLVRYLDVLIVAERPVGEYLSFLEGETPIVVELPVVVDLVSIFERDFGGGRCCD